MGNAVAARRAAQPPVSGQALRILKDERLAAMVAAGNDDAFAVLYRRHHQAVYRYCHSLLRREADARDALQSSMLAALASLRARPIDGAFKPWLFRIAHNESISIIRGRSQEASGEDHLPAAVTDDLDTREQFRTLVSDLGALPERQRGAIVMRELSGLSYTEIAAALGTTEAAGKQLVYEARTALHELRAGREMSCELVRKRISADDLRLLRGRKVRSHLRGCEPCQDFEQAIRRRRAALAALAPPLAPLAAAAVLREVFASGGSAGGAGGAGGATAAIGLASGGAPLAGPVGLKMMAAALIVGAAGVGAYAAGNAILSDGGATAPVAAEAQGAVAPGQARSHDVQDQAGAGPRHGARAGSDRTGGAAPAGVRPAADGPAAGGSEMALVNESAPIETAASTTPAAAEANDPTGAGPSGDGAGGGDTTDQPQTSAPASPTGPGSPSPDPPPSPSPEPPPTGGGGSVVAPGTPPGHGGPSPNQGGTAPGQAAGGTPPGHLGNPGNGGGH